MHAFHLLHALWVTLAIAAPITIYQGESLRIRDVNSHAARTYSSTDSMIDKRAANPGNAENSLSNIEIAPRKLFRRFRPLDFGWGVTQGAFQSFWNEVAAKIADKWVAPVAPAAPAAAPVMVPTVQPGTDRPEYGHPSDHPSSDQPDPASMPTTSETLSMFSPGPDEFA